MSAKKQTIEWVKELFAGLGEFAGMVFDPLTSGKISSISKIGYSEWNSRQEFLEYLRKKRKVLNTRKDSSQKIFHAIWQLEKQKVVSIKKESSHFSLSLTLKGFLKFLRMSTIQHKPKVWDGKWRIVVFDIPEKYKSAREVLRRYLYELGFSQIQKSVFATKEERLKEVRRLMIACEMETFTQYFVATEWKPSSSTDFV